MPNRYDPNFVSLNTVEEPVWTYNNFSKWNIWKFWNSATRIWKINKSTKNTFGLLPKMYSCRRVIPSNIGQGVEELTPSCGREQNFHQLPSESSVSASDITSSRVNPLPCWISFSPRTSESKRSRSYMVFSYSPTLSSTAAALPRCVITIGSFVSLIFLRTSATPCLRSETGMIAGIRAITCTSNRTTNGVQNDQPKQAQSEKFQNINQMAAQQSGGDRHRLERDWEREK